MLRMVDALSSSETWGSMSCWLEDGKDAMAESPEGVAAI